MVAALEDYAKFAAKPSETVKKPLKTSASVVREELKVALPCERKEKTR
jgi:hypothetical protein